MSKKRTLITLGLLLALSVIALWIDQRSSAIRAPLVTLGNVSHLEISYLQKTLRLTRATTWTLDTFDGKPVLDHRVNQDLVVHLLDLAQALLATTYKEFDPKLAPEYGISNPSLIMRMSWQLPFQGEESIFFGHRDLSERQVFAFFPNRPLLLQVPAHTLLLLEGKQPLDLRDRRITTFDVDDVEDLRISGKCKNFQLHRDGDRWRNKMSSESTKIDKWLNTLLATTYDQINESQLYETHELENKFCTISLSGRRQRKESIDLYKDKASTIFWAVNSALPAFYGLSGPEMLKALVPPNETMAKN